MGGYMGRSKKERKILGSITRWVWVAKTKKSRKIKRNLNVEKTEANLFQRSHVTGGCLGAKIMRISKRIASGMIKCRCVSWNYFKKENRTLEKNVSQKHRGC